ncbi:MFS general substrate transporter [Teratosphaeria nubilosa]|uniref:Cercosporin MFS transporter CTB4 n=1 Tax=Teratosphaeria nubilosa TaxID=161662 RepID=A0A6G1KWL6_9PEZI|nr:MFS general substrate transporter [Teratosphaeria nubilosa]
MTELIRDTSFGHLVRFVSRGKYLKYQEEADPSIWTRYIDEKKSGYLAHHGNPNPPEDDSEMEGIGGVRTREDQFTLQPPANRQGLAQRTSFTDSSKTRVGGQDANINHASGVKIDPEKGRDLHIVSWYGPNDPENPQNWSQFKKFFVTFEICLLTTSVYIGSSIYSAGTESVVAIFGVSRVAATLGLTLFVAGYGLGPMLWSPMSEIPQVGRNPIYIGTLVIFVAFQAPTALATNFGMLLAFRFLTGFFGSPVLATGGASLSDMYAPKQRAYAMSIWGIAAVCGPTLGPLIGGFAVQYGPVRGGFTAPWTWPIWELMWLSGFCLVFLFFFFPETSANNILVRRTKRLRKLTGDDKLICEPELMSEQMTGKDIVMMSLVRPITLNFLEPMVFLLNLYIALIYGLLYIWFESFYIVFVEIYGFGLGLEGVAFLGILVGAIVVILPFFFYLKKYMEPRFDENGNIRPEERLTPAFVGAFCIPICLFWFGWSARPDVHWIVPIIGTAWFSIGAFLLFNSVLNYLPDAYPEVAASVLAGNDFMRSSFGAGFPLFATAMYTKLGVDWASSLLGFLAVAFIPIPFVLYRYGETLRKNHSKYARKDI